MLLLLIPGGAVTTPDFASSIVQSDAPSATTPLLEIAAATHAGPRRTNADAYLIDEAAGLFAVADGVGDTARSHLVAQMALEAVRELFGIPWSLLPFGARSTTQAAERLVLGLLQANARLHARRRAEGQRTAATFAGVVVCPDRICVGHAGDSRVYLLRRATGRLTKLTEDHTLLSEALWRGVPCDAAAEMADGHVLTRAVGTRSKLEVQPIVTGWAPGDVALLCTDGVSDRVEAGAIGRTLLAHDDLGEAAQDLVDSAIQRGGQDNATALCVRWARGDDDDDGTGAVTQPAVGGDRRRGES